MADAAVWMVLAAFLTFAVTSFGTFLIWSQVRLTRQAVTDTSKATRAMERQNEIADDTAKRQLRAYVMAKDHAVVNLQVGETPVFMCRLQNFGHTPAYDVRCVASIFASGDDPDGAKIFFRLINVEGTLSRDVIGGGDFKVLPIPANMAFTEAHFAELFAGAKLVFAGFISYRDAFKRRRLSTFKTFLFLTKTPDPEGVDLMSCAKGNNGN